MQSDRMTRMTNTLINSNGKITVIPWNCNCICNISDFSPYRLVVVVSRMKWFSQHFFTTFTKSVYRNCTAVDTSGT